MRRISPVTLWLYICCAMIFVMALLGAITRLTESGLSITDWKPITGALPPLNAEQWNKAFGDYKNIPQYQLINHGMSLEEFKGIFFWEWFHRLWGRIIGLVFAVPLVVFYATKKISGTYFLKLCCFFALGGLQGFIGWFMVQSGLEVRTTVSPYRLALHLGFALLLYGLLLWTALNRGTSFPRKRESSAGDSLQESFRANTRNWIPAFAGMTSESIHGWITFGFLVTTIIWGAFVAGLRAGGAYNTWPLMDGSFIPNAAWSLQPVWLNFFANTALVQFVHRWLGPTTFVLILSWVIRCWEKADEAQRRWLYALAVMSFVQVILGLSTLLSHVQIVIAVMHQAGAIVLLTLLLTNLQRLASTKTSNK